MSTSPPEGQIKVLVAEDQKLIRNYIVQAIEEDPTIKVVGESGSAKEACDLYKQLNPDVVLMDILFQDDFSGLDAIRSILKYDADASIVVISQHDQVRMIKESYAAGAKAFITKFAAEPKTLTEAIVKAAQNEVFFMNEIAKKLAILQTKLEVEPIDKLSEREYDVFKGIVLGKTNQEISQDLNLALKTVTNASHSLKQKLGIHRTADLVRFAIEHGVINLRGTIV